MGQTLGSSSHHPIKMQSTCTICRLPINIVQEDKETEKLNQVGVSCAEETKNFTRKEKDTGI